MWSRAGPVVVLAAGTGHLNSSRLSERLPLVRSMPCSGLPYSWRDLSTEVSIELPLPGGLGGRDVRCVVLRRELRLAVEGVGVVFDGLTAGEVDEGESSWAVETDGAAQPKRLCISLAKRANSRGELVRWTALFEGEEVRGDSLGTPSADDGASDTSELDSLSSLSSLSDAFGASSATSFHPTGKRPPIRLVDTQRRPSQLGELVNSRENAALASRAFCERVMQRTQARLDAKTDIARAPVEGKGGAQQLQHDAQRDGFISRALELADMWPGAGCGDLSAGLSKSVVLRTGVRMAYSEWGDLQVDRRRGGRVKQTLVLLHGAGECRQIWSRLAWHLTGHQRAVDRDNLLMSWYHVIAIDLRAHGATEGREGETHLNDFVEDLDAFSEAVGLNVDREETRQYCVIGGTQDVLLRDEGSKYHAHWSVAGVGLGAAIAATYVAKQTRRHVKGGWARGRVRSAALVEFEADAPSVRCPPRT